MMDRRSFLGKAVAAGAITTIGAVGLQACKKEISNEELGLPPMLDRAPDGKKLKAALVGCGNRGTGAALDFMASGPNLELIALGDVFPDKVEECRQKLSNSKVEVPKEKCFSGFDAYKAILEKDIDIVLLATPPHFRPIHLKACIAAKKHVFMEKPACVDPVGARSIMASSRKAEALGLTIITGTQRRHKRDYVETYKRIANGAIGNLVSARAWWLQSHVWFRTREKVSPYVQEHIHLVTAIRTNKPVQEAERTAVSTLTAVMGRISAYTGKKVTWDEMMNSTLRLGPQEYELDDVDMEFEVPEPGTQHRST